MSRCECCDLPVTSCGKAAETRQRAQAVAVKTRLLGQPGWFPAVYAGSCAGCGEHFAEGAPIRRQAPDGLSRRFSWIAECCG